VSPVQIRRYEPYMVAEVDMPQDAGPAAGEGFNDLAGYIFGGNNRYVL
jgi:SOUL heme-binding protein